MTLLPTEFVVLAKHGAGSKMLVVLTVGDCSLITYTLIIKQLRWLQPCHWRLVGCVPGCGSLTRSLLMYENSSLPNWT